MIRAFSLFVINALLTGCSLWGQPEIPQLVLHINAASNINANVEGIPSPLELKVYQLTDSQAFALADFMQIFSDDQGVLKAELLLARQLSSMLPGERRKEVIPLAANTKFIGIIAGFADYREAKNKAIYQAIAGKAMAGSTMVVNIEIDGINLSVSDQR